MGGQGRRFRSVAARHQHREAGAPDVPIPESLIREVELEHPDYPEFAGLGLRWYAVPILSDMLLEIGGVSYPAAPFNGWYMETEIGTRNFGDKSRYNRLAEVADALGLDRSSNTTLWKDRALVELNRAVLYSFKRDGVSIVDHHTAADQFVLFQQQEGASGREVSARWSWLIPPMSPSATPIWHDSGMKELDLRPRLLQQTPPYRVDSNNPLPSSGACPVGMGSPMGAERITPSTADQSAGAASSGAALAGCPFHHGKG